MKKKLESLVGERVVLTIIVANAIVLILRGFPGHPPAVAGTLFALDYAFTLFFVFELVTKVALVGFRRYWAVGWNRLDLVLVVVSAPALLELLIEVHHFEVVLALRLMRLLRVLRGFRFIPESERLWEGSKRALRASVGVLLALIVFDLIFGLGAQALFGHVAPEYFENPILSMYSMFKVFTLEGWYEIPDTIAMHASPTMGVLARVYFTLAVIVGGLVILSLANAVFVDEMVVDNSEPMEASLEELHGKIDAAKGTTEARLAEVEASLRRVEELLSRGKRSDG